MEKSIFNLNLVPVYFCVNNWYTWYSNAYRRVILW